MKKFYLKAFLQSLKMLFAIVMSILLLFTIGIPLYMGLMFCFSYIIDIVIVYWKTSIILAAIGLLVWYGRYLHKRALVLKKWDDWAQERATVKREI